ncbi:hypothetical protein F7725_004562 [Dissostichus mawsoni]|uniref:Uncharacterized protein n=1 Tax=Dissostichus mawsoni TaxID=36200 RepID=A0A7J5XLQ8_DISMA|nr:hypothetical protein F7725_004562 [Dissostichus mawsoni]
MSITGALGSSSTLTVDPQLLREKENRALLPSVSLGPQYLSLRLVLAGLPPFGMARAKSATTVILPSVEHTDETANSTSSGTSPRYTVNTRSSGTVPEIKM